MEWPENEVDGKSRSYHIASLWEIYENGIAGGRTSDTVTPRLEWSSETGMA